MNPPLCFMYHQLHVGFGAVYDIYIADCVKLVSWERSKDTKLQKKKLSVRKCGLLKAMYLKL